MSNAEPAIIVDREGLARQVANRPLSFILFELLQNAWDEDGVTVVHASIEPIPGKAQCKISVEDDSPEGFSDLASIYTMFRTSKKAPDPTKRGRFEMGEKLVIALALEAQVVTTKGTIVFDRAGRRKLGSRRKEGSLFTGIFSMTREQIREIQDAVKTLAPPHGKKTYVNGELLEAREPLHTFDVTLQTISDNLLPTQRQTKVHVYAVRPGETAHIYEMGLPVVETGDQWHYDVQQRVPVNWERNNVPPSYLKTLRVAVLNAMHDQLSEQQAEASWVSIATADPRCQPDAVTTVVRQRFGEKVVINDPSDTEGTKIAVSKGYTVIPGGAFSKDAWANIKAAGAALPAGQVTPSPKPYDPEGHPEQVIPEDEWTPDMQRLSSFSRELFEKLCGAGCFVVIVREPQASWTANFGEHGGESRLCLNYGRLGKRWFALPKRDPKVLDLLLHEYCHHTVHDHLSAEMHETATLLGAKLANLALDQPELFQG